MALTACPECATEISDTALNCGVQLGGPREGFGEKSLSTLSFFSIY